MMKLFLSILGVLAIFSCTNPMGEITTVQANPTGSTATSGDGKVSVSWSAVSGATSYNVYWSTTKGVTKANGTKITAATSPNVITGLTNGRSYYLIVTSLVLG